MKYKKYEMYLDLKGIFGDFITTALKVQSHDLKTVFDSWKRTQPRLLVPTLSTEKNPVEFFKTEVLEREKFWRDYRAYDWFIYVQRKLSTIGNVMFLCSLSGASGYLAGKYHWHQDFLGVNLSKYILTRHKDIIARGKTRLIDDISLKISAVKARAGKVFSFPRIWNRFHTIYESTEYVHPNIKKIINRQKFLGNNY